MAGKPSKPMTPFDKSVTPSYLYKWKLFLAFLPPSIQRFLAVYIKFTEFRYTMDYFRGLPFHAFSFQSISELAPYMGRHCTSRFYHGQRRGSCWQKNRQKSRICVLSGALIKMSFRNISLKGIFIYFSNPFYDILILNIFNRKD